MYNLDELYQNRDALHSQVDWYGVFTRIINVRGKVNVLENI